MSSVDFELSSSAFVCEFCARDFFDPSDMFQHVQVCHARVLLEEQERRHKQDVGQLIHAMRETDHLPSSEGYRLLNVKIKLLHEQIQRVIRQNQVLMERLLSPNASPNASPNDVNVDNWFS